MARRLGRVAHLAHLLCCLVLACSTDKAGKGRASNLKPKIHMYDHITKYEIMVPQWLSSEPRESVLSHNQHPTWAEIRVTAEGRDHVLQIQKNEQLLAPSYAETHYTQDGEERTTFPGHKAHCFYHGNVKGFEHSTVVLSTCGGLRGLIILNSNISYFVEPIDDSHSRHLIYRSEYLKLKSGTCGHQPSEHKENWFKDFTVHLHPSHHRSKRDVVKDMKYVELYLVADYAEFQKHHRDLEKTKQKLKETANYVDKYYRSLNIRIALVHLEVWTHQNRCDVRENPYSTLWSFLKWRRQVLTWKKHDNAQLITGITFNGTTIGLAPLMGMCSDYQSGGVNMDHSDSAVGVAATMAHEMGHNFGMSHDSDGCCSARPEDGGCIMAAATGDPFPKVFNKCNEKELQKYLHEGGGMCLFNMPDVNTLYGGRRCGNGYVEEGEQCDCGEVEECTNICCNANNCTLKVNAECAHGICCHNCKLKSSGTVCRKSSGPCDLPEYCSGTSEFCPANFYQMDGVSCDGGQAYCYNGMCLTYENQCVLLWGAGARVAPTKCFESVNVAGDTYGNCGKDHRGNYRKCDTRNAKCGKIQCQSDAKKPLGTNAVAIDTTIVANGKRVQCRGTHVYTTPELEGDMLDPGLVMTGTKCTDNHICFEGRCQNASFLAADECAAKCHNHGVCNNNHNCHCEPGWAPPFCNKQGHGGSVDGGVGKPDYNSLVAAGIVVPVILLLCGIGVLLYYCYQRRYICPQGIRNSRPDAKQFCGISNMLKDYERYVKQNVSSAVSFPSADNIDQKTNNSHSNPTFQIRSKDAKTGQQQSPAVPSKPRLPHSVHPQHPSLLLPTLRSTSPSSNSQQDFKMTSPRIPGFQSPITAKDANVKFSKQTPPNRPLPADPLPRTPKSLQSQTALSTGYVVQMNKRPVLPPSRDKPQERRIGSKTGPYRRDHP
ncbi:disintegrin and metalloproteinase domain-containing protein 19 [Hemitrygon akajei]|uniref:disintegrin and metalloproteinase domain-containing protein 19 n=1 Tax=Hemitrygon akajei TaxID=2704970 RepID=UPI003BFA1EDA